MPGAIRKGVPESAAAKNDKGKRGLINIVSEPRTDSLSVCVSDMRSIYVGNVDYGTAPEELQAHFASCGTIDRVTILCNKWTGKPMGYAYVMFVKVSDCV